MARPKNRRTKKKSAPISTPAAAETKTAETAEVKETKPAPKEAPAETKETETAAKAVIEEAKAAPAAVKEAKPAAKKAPVQAKEPKAAEKKPTAKSEAARKDTFVFQSSGKEYTADEITELCKAAYRNGTRKQVRSCNVYLKNENGGLRAYYVINGNADGAFIDL